jgi:anti-anti-sigma factor
VVRETTKAGPVLGELLTTHVVLGTPSRVLVAGEVDVSTARELDAALTAATGDVRIDCRGLTFLDSQGISLFLDHYVSRMAEGHSLVLEHLTPIVQRTLEITGVLAMLQGAAQQK